MRPAEPNPDIRWQQRFANYQHALAQLETFFEPPALNVREQQGLIKAFEYTFELGWNTLRDLLRSQGNSNLLGSRDTLREAFRLGLIADGQTWMLMIQDRNLTSHTYNRGTADAIAANIGQRYLVCFQQLRDRLQLMAAIDELLLPWQVDLTLKHELPPDLLAHLARVGQRLWRRPQAITKGSGTETPSAADPR